MDIRKFFRYIVLMSFLFGMIGLPAQITKAEQPDPGLLARSAPPDIDRPESVALELDDVPVRKEYNLGAARRALDSEIQPWAPSDAEYQVFEIEDIPTETAAQSRAGTTCTVTSAADSGAGTLRECMANAAADGTILFNTTTFNPAAPTTIALTSSRLPNIMVDNLTIDASNAGVILDGSALSGDTFGFVIYNAQGVTIRGFQITGFTVGVIIIDAGNNVIGGDRGIGNGPMGQGNLISNNSSTGVHLQNQDTSNTSNNIIIGNFIGTDLTGTNAHGAQQQGVVIGWGASNNVVGGTRPSTACEGNCNVISGNSVVGVGLRDSGTIENQIIGNFIGTNAAGDLAVPNKNGILIWKGPSNNEVGRVGAGEGNLISGNINVGIDISYAGTDGNQVIGNRIGTDASGTLALPNYYGIIVGFGAMGTLVGGTDAGAGNLISGNGMVGLWIDGTETTGTQVMGNRIGTDLSGTAALANYEGVIISTGSTGNQVGGTTPGAGNLISGNTWDGIFMQSLTSPGNLIVGNRIGTNASGTAAIPNYYGIYLDWASYNTVGGTQSSAGNLISGNIDSGLYLFESNNNQVMGNKIGSDLSGTLALSNGDYGIYVLESSSNTIGGVESGAGNLVSGNGIVGILVGPETSLNNQILGNRIGTNLAGNSAIPNNIGIGIVKARETLIGGADTDTPWVCDGPCNLISGNSVDGVVIQGIIGGETSASSGNNRELTGQLNQVLGNFIGTDIAGTSAIPNGVYGISMKFEANGNQVGGSSLMGEGNLISGNNSGGVSIRGLLTDGNQVAGNRIGTNLDGNAPLGNGERGILINESASNNIVGGDEPGMGNLISGYDSEDLISHFGLVIETFADPPAQNNQVVGNKIGTNAAGNSAVPNSTGIFLNQLVTGTVVRDNIISGNALRGILVNQASGNEFTGNLIGLAAGGTSPLTNQMGGVIIRDSQDNTLGPGNGIAFHQYGVLVVMASSSGNTITQNSIFNNTDKQIAFFEDSGEPLVPLPVSAPALTVWDEVTMEVSGTACAGCLVEVFDNWSPQPAGKKYLGTVTADGEGNFSLMVGPGNIFLAATATNTGGTTSEFSASLQVGTLLNVYLPLILK